jgi:predicted transcriptional regulator
MLFSWKRRRTDPPPSPTRLNPLPPAQLDWPAFADASAWPSIKVWLTDEMCFKLDGLAAYRDQTRSEVMRDLLFIGLFGHYVYAQLVAEHRGLPRSPTRLEYGEQVHFSLQQNADAVPDPSKEPKKPKQRVNVRLFVPAPMKERLETLAERQQQTLSVCTRTLLQQTLSGVML